MKILLTGGTGFLGGRLLQILLTRGYSVRLLVRESKKRREIPPEAEVFYGDVCSLDSVVKACDGCDVVIHTAALVEAWVRDFRKFEEVNVGGLKNILESIQKIKTVKKVIYISSFFALGPTDGFIGNEEQVHPGNNFCTEYERTKWMAEILSQEAIREGLPIVSVYPGVIFGPGNLTSGNFVTQLINDHLRGRLPGLLGSGTSIFPYVYIDDVCEAISLALERGKIGKKYLLVGENASLVDLFNVVETMTGKPRPKIHIPLSIVRILGDLSIFFAYFGGPTPIFTAESIRVFAHDWAYSRSLTCEDLGFRFRSLTVGVRDTLLWLKETKNVKISIKDE